MGKIIQSIFGKHIGLIFLVLIGYTIMVVVLLKKLNIWESGLLKDTIFWFFGFVIVIFFSIDKASQKGYFRKIFREVFKWTILIEFLVNFYTFSLVAEIILLPILLFLSVTQVYAESYGKDKQVSDLLKKILSFVELCYFGFALYKTITRYQDFFTLSSLKELILPAILSILILPLFYLIAVYILYGELFVQTDFMTKSINAQGKTRRAIFLTAGISLAKIEIIRKGLNKAEIQKSNNLRRYFRNIVQRKDNE